MGHPEPVHSFSYCSEMEAELCYLDDHGHNGLDFPKLPHLHVNRPLRDIGLRTIFGHAHPPVWLRRKSHQMCVKPINLPLADENQINELPLPGCCFWQRLILLVKLPWAGQRNEILGSACLSKRLCSVRSLHLEVYLRPQPGLHVSRRKHRQCLRLCLLSTFPSLFGVISLSPTY